MPDYILQLEDISKYFGPVIALNGVTLRLQRGEVHCLLGDNGAGKSTLIKTLAGVHLPEKGQYLVEGKPVRLVCPQRKNVAGEIVWLAGPWRSSGDWWEQDGWARDEWDIALNGENGFVLYRLVRDVFAGQWMVEGAYD